MKFLSTVTSMFLLSATTASTTLNIRSNTDNGVDSSSSLEQGFLSWMKHHGKTYETTQQMMGRMEIWTQNHLFIEKHNNQMPAPSYTVGHNQFSDFTVDEYKEFNKLGPYSPGMLTERKSSSDFEVNVETAADETVTTLIARRAQELPDSVDWIQAGALAPVKNQGMCGSCWAFSAICAIEGAHFVDTGSQVSLSEQELVDCDPLDAGCGGGLMDNAFLFDENMTGICSEEDYPYAGHKRWIRGCAAKKGLCEGVEHTRVKSFIDVSNTADDLMGALVEQPVSVAIEADKQSFMLYKSGVYDDPECGVNLDHGVAAVGYGTTDEGQDYFLVRNSWGETWGDSGYIKMSRQSETVNGTCGILSFASRPLLRED